MTTLAAIHRTKAATRGKEGLLNEGRDRGQGRALRRVRLLAGRSDLLRPGEIILFGSIEERLRTERFSRGLLSLENLYP